MHYLLLTIYYLLSTIYCPIDHWSYQIIDQLETRGLIDTLLFADKPYTHQEIENITNSIKPKDNYEKFLIKKLKTVFHELPARTTSTNFGGEVRFVVDTLNPRVLSQPWASFNIGKFSIYEKVRIVTRHGENEPDYKGYHWKQGMTGFFLNSYISCEIYKFNLLFGRQKFYWGPGKKSALLISSHSPPFDILALSTSFKNLKMSYFSARLDNMGDTTRYLSAHRINFRIKPWLVIGLSETILYGGKNRLPEISYLNPVALYFASQWNINTDDNLFWAIDIKLRPFRGAILYGEFLIDDLQYEPDRHNEPNELGGIIGTSLSKGKFGCELEYSRINAWTYNQKKDRNKYLHYNSLIGSWLGPDGHYLSLDLKYRPVPCLCTELNFNFIEHGVADSFGVFTHWPIETKEDTFPSDYFLLGGVDKQSSNISIKFDYAPSLYFELTAQAGYFPWREEKEFFGKIILTTRLP